MARTRPNARKNDTGSSSSYGLVSDAALLPPPPVGNDETTTDSSEDNASTETHPTAPSDTIIETPTGATSELPTAPSAAITEMTTVPPEPPTDPDPSAALTETTTVPPKPPTDPDRSVAIAEMSTAPTDERTEPQNSTNIESSNGPSTTATTETTMADGDNFMNFELPRKIDYLDKDALNNMLQNDELCFISFKTLCECYFQHKQLMQLCNLTYELPEDKKNKNVSFLYASGKKKVTIRF